MAEETNFVARQPELAFLDQRLDKAIGGQGQMCFVTGNAGAGKTSLVAEFIRRAQEKHPDLVSAVGVCDAQTGSGDPYLPFREIYELLTGNTETRVARGQISKESARRLGGLFSITGDILVQLGPDLFDLFIPGSKLLATAGALIIKKTEWSEKLKRRLEDKSGLHAAKPAGLDQNQIFEQYINVLCGLARKVPLVLVLEDLHWADPDSINMLFRLGRRLEGNRILVIGSYRPGDIAIGRGGERHPLAPVISEMKRQFGQIEIDLDQVQTARGREFVDAYLDSESNRLDSDFRQALYRHTGSHPLFTVELLRHMQQSGDLVKDADGCWGARANLRWNSLPSRIEGIFEEGIGRLGQELRESLTIGSVEGEQFTAEVVAQVKSIEVRNLVRQFSGELEKEMRLLESQGVERVGQQRLSHYRFTSKLMQAYLYDDLDEVELSYLHEDVGSALEEMYGSQSAEVAVQLAHHFDLAGVTDKARRYLELAGEQAAARYALNQALENFTRALELTPETDIEARWRLLLAREQVYDLQAGRDLQAKDLDALDQIARQAGSPEKQSEAALRRSQLAINLADYPSAIRYAEQVIQIAQPAGDRLRQAAGQRLWGRGLREQGQYDAARQHLEMARDLAQEDHADAVWAMSLYELGALAYFSGDYAQAQSSWQTVLDFYRRHDDRRGQGLVLRGLGLMANKTGEHTSARAFAEEALRLSREVGDRPEEARCLITTANTARHQGDLTAAKNLYEQALGMYRQSGNRAWEGLALMNLGYVTWETGDFASARTLLEQALVIQRETGNRWAQSSCLENLGMVLRDLGEPQHARLYLDEGLEICQAAGIRDGEGTILNEIGIAALDLGDPARAREAFERAYTLNQELGNRRAAAEALAGLVQVDALQGAADQALAHAGDLFAYLEQDPDLSGAQRPLRVYMACFQALRAAGDARAEALLERGYWLLMARAARIQDENARRSFLQNIPIHREVTQAFQRSSEQPLNPPRPG